jgi:hypothetical protein
MKQEHHIMSEIINQKIGGGDSANPVGFKQQKWVERIEVK